MLGDDAICAVPSRSWPVPTGLVVQRRRDGRTAILGPAEAAVWSRARRPVPWPADPAEDAVVRRLVAAGLLERLGDVRQRLVAVPGAAPPPVSALYVPTRGPSAHLDRLLAALRGAPAPVRVVVDDPDPGAADALRGRGVDVIGPVERAAFARALAEASGDPEAVAAALEAPPGPWRVGAVRNLILLLALDRSVVSVDDDIVPEGVASEPTPPALASDSDPTAVSFTADRAEAWRGADPVDLAALHGAALGRRAAAVWEGGALDGATPDLIATVADGADVAVTMAGLAGDNASSRIAGVLSLAPPTLGQFALGYEAHLASRAVRRAVRRTTVTDGPFLMTACVGLDGRAPLPPFFPSYRDSDGVWGAMIAAIRPGLVAHLPIALRHDPTDRRTHARGDLARDATRFRWSDLVTSWVRARRLAGSTPAERLASLAHHVRTLAEEPVLAEVVGDVARIWLAGMAGLVERARAVAGPPAWSEDLAAARAAVGAALARPPGPEEHLRDGVLDEERLRADLRRLATLLARWPALREAARAVTASR